MSIFDKLKKAVNDIPAAAPRGAVSKTFTFAALPESLEQMQALPEASLSDPFQTAALTVCALCAYGADRAVGTVLTGEHPSTQVGRPMGVRKTGGGFAPSVRLLQKELIGK